MIDARGVEESFVTFVVTGIIKLYKEIIVNIVALRDLTDIVEI